MRYVVLLTCFLGVPAVAATPNASQIAAPGLHAAAATTPILKGFPKKDRSKKKGGRRKAERSASKRGGGGGGGKCARLAQQHGLPRSECEGGKGACKRLAQKYSLPKSACRDR
jgi:hypothetical protein